ncbi:MAG: hypothetical protein ABUL48_02590 [Pseudorhodoplanes sp.]
MKRAPLLIAAVLTCGIVLTLPVSQALAQAQQVQGTQAQSSRMQAVKTKTKESWQHMKARWAAQREKSRDCRQQAKAQRLTGQKVRKFLDDCMSN